MLAALGLAAFVESVLVISRALRFHSSGSPLLALGVLAGALVLFAVAARPQIGLCLFLLTFPMNNESLELSFVTVSPPNVLLVAMAMGLLARRVFGRRKSAANPVFWPKFLLLSWFLMAGALSALMAPNTGAAARFLITRAGYVLTFLVILALISDVEKLKSALRFIVWSASAAAAVAALGAFFPYSFPLALVRCNEPVLPVLNTLRCTGFNLSFHAFGSWLLVALPVAAGSIVYPKFLGISRRIAIALGLLLLGGLIIGQVRGAWVTLLVAIPILLAFAARPKRGEGFALPAYLFLSALIGIVLLFGIWNVFIHPIVAMRPDNFWGRIASYQVALQIFRQHWLFGTGPLDERFLSLETLGYSVVDNAFLVEIAATGLLGAVPFLLLWYGGFRSCIANLSEPTKPELRRLAAILGMSLFFLLISVQAYIAVGEKTPWVLLGLVAALVRIQASGKIGRSLMSQVKVES